MKLTGRARHDGCSKPRMCSGPVQRRVRPPRRPRWFRTARATVADRRSGCDTPRCVRPTATLSRGRGDGRHLTPDPHPLCPRHPRGAAEPTRCAEVCAAAAFSVRAAGSATPSCSAPEATDASGPGVSARGDAEELSPAERWSSPAAHAAMGAGNHACAAVRCSGGFGLLAGLGGSAPPAPPTRSAGRERHAPVRAAHRNAQSGPRGRPPPHPRPASAVPAAHTRRRGADAPRRGVCGRRILCPGRGVRNPLVLRAPGHRRGRTRGFARGGGEELSTAERISSPAAHAALGARNNACAAVRCSGGFGLLAGRGGSAPPAPPTRIRRAGATRPGACGPPQRSVGAAGAPATSPPTRIRCARGTHAAPRSRRDAPRCVRPPHSLSGPRGPQPPRAPRPRPPTRAGQGSPLGATRRSCPPPNDEAHRPRTPRWVRETTDVRRSGAAAGSASSPASAVPRRPRHRRASAERERHVAVCAAHRLSPSWPRGRPPPHSRPASAVPAAPTRCRGADAMRRGVCGRRILGPGRGVRNPLVPRAPGHRRERARGLRSGRRGGAVTPPNEIAHRPRTLRSGHPTMQVLRFGAAPGLARGIGRLWLSARARTATPPRSSPTGNVCPIRHRRVQR
ncbi:hypothetical protein FTUN_6191 [Frigoriglobus tundricola]|uniref:Uncharacterized protein n=1 Tax=Frigoriglobus tundricola TaxID=2774151 RepID=A0A6M5YYR8_9BACT|nr:hypothetical protein FTUN_6191 [Frigoriglobus tundricola]